MLSFLALCSLSGIYKIHKCIYAPKIHACFCGHMCACVCICVCIHNLYVSLWKFVGVYGNECWHACRLSLEKSYSTLFLYSQCNSLSDFGQIKASNTIVATVAFMLLANATQLFILLEGQREWERGIQKVFHKFTKWYIYEFITKSVKNSAFLLSFYFSFPFDKIC